MVVELASKRHPVEDPAEAIEYSLPSRAGPTGCRLCRRPRSGSGSYSNGCGSTPRRSSARFLPRARTITAEKLAINAVMAGCLPEYGPVPGGGGRGV